MNQLRHREPLLFQDMDEELMASITDTLSMVMVPVTATSSSSSGAVTSIKEQQTISATVIYSAQYEENPMEVEVVYSGFPYDW